jgi:hypothetical protein
VIAICGVAGLSAAVPTSAQAVDTSFVLWTGGRTPDSPLVGLHLAPNGTAQLLSAPNRASDSVKVLKAYKPTAKQLLALRKAAAGALTGPEYAGQRAEDGFYATAIVQVGAKRRALIGANDLQPKLSALLGAVAAALPPGTASATARATVRQSLARAAVKPSTAPCPAGQQATRYGREISLKQAAALGIAKLTSKGGFDGDRMAVRAGFKDLPLPTVVRMDVEVVTATDSGLDIEFEAEVEKKLQGYTIGQGPLKGQPVRFDLNVVRRSPSTPPRPCHHQMAITGDPNLRASVSGLGPDLQAGEVTTTSRPPWAHEMLHLAGLDDRYDDYFLLPGGKVVKLPENGLEAKELVAELAKLGVNTKGGKLFSKPHKGWEGNIMGRNTGKLFLADLLEFAKLGQDTIIIHGAPGDLLVSKAGQQNVITGAPFDLTIRRGQAPVQVDGMVVYCVDVSRKPPERGTVFDVLGPAIEQPDFAMQALARVMRVIARRQPEPLFPTPGAQSAVWRVTDNSDPSPLAVEILREAQVDPDTDRLQFNAPHYGNPNAGSPESGAVTPTGVVPAPQFGLPPRRLTTPRLALQRALVVGRVLARDPRLLLTLQVTVATGAGGKGAALTLERAGRRGFRRTRTLRAPTLDDGVNTITLILSGLPPGSYRFKITGGGRTRYAAFIVR